MYTPHRTPRIVRVLTGFTIALLLAVLVTPQSALAQDSEPSQQDKAMHYSLYYENFKNEDYAAAMPDLRWMLDNAPLFPNDDDRNFERAVEAYAALAVQAEDENTKQAYLDSAVTVLRTAPEQLKEAGADYQPYAWEIQKGRFVQRLSGEGVDATSIEGIDDPRVHYRNAFDMAPDKVQPYYINQIIQGYMESNQQQEALAFMDNVEKARSDDEEVMSVVSEARRSVFGTNPDAQIDYLAGLDNPSPEQKAQLLKLYMEQGYVDEASQLAEEVMQNDPPVEIVREVAQLRLEDGKPQAAFEAYQAAMDGGVELTADDYYNMGIAQQRLGQLSKARTYFRKATEQDSQFGRAYLAIGDLYAKAVSECGGSKMSRNDRAVYWAALDMYQRAKQVDGSLASQADSKISTYSQYMPSSEDIFYRSDWEAGSSFRIDYGCYSWINETTTVRNPS